MKQAFTLIAILGLVGFGCAKKAADHPTNESVTDISAPTNPGYQQTAAAQPVAPQPVITDSMQTQPMDPASGGTMAGGAYTIKKGDTLYSIARQRFGDGKHWTRIADANPGVDPTKLRVGQTINIP